MDASHDNVVYRDIAIATGGAHYFDLYA